jgi:hypothetical protein
MEWMDKILRLNKGEQNRHGEIEYEYPLEERIQLLSDILNESNLDGLTSKEKSELQSAIYWGLCGSITQIEKFLILLMPKYHHKTIQDALLLHFTDNHILFHRVNVADYLLSKMERLNLPHTSWKMELKIRIERWLKEDQDEISLKKLEGLYLRFKS